MECGTGFCGGSCPNTCAPGQVCVSNICEDVFANPREDTIWAMFNKGCIRLNTELLSESRGDVYLIYGIPWDTEILIESNFDLTIGEYEWDIFGCYPSVAEIKIVYQNSGDIIYSEQFKIVSPTNSLSDEC